MLKLPNSKFYGNFDILHLVINCLMWRNSKFKLSMNFYLIVQLQVTCDFSMGSGHPVHNIYYFKFVDLNNNFYSETKKSEL